MDIKVKLSKSKVSLTQIHPKKKRKKGNYVSLKLDSHLPKEFLLFASMIALEK